MSAKALMWKIVPCALAAALLAAMPASAAEKQRWAFLKYDEIALLFYGIPESEAGTLYLSCNTKTKAITVITPVMPKKAAKGNTGKITLTNGGTSLEYAGKVVEENEESGIQFEAATGLDTRLFAILETGPSLGINAMGAKDQVPLAGVKGPLAKMRRACA